MARAPRLPRTAPGGGNKAVTPQLRGSEQKEKQQSKPTRLESRSSLGPPQKKTAAVGGWGGLGGAGNQAKLIKTSTRSHLRVTGPQSKPEGGGTTSTYQRGHMVQREKEQERLRRLWHPLVAGGSTRES